VRLALAKAGCLLLTAACTDSDSSSGPLLTTSTPSSSAAPAPVVTTTTGTTADRPTGPVDKACSLLTIDEVEHAFGPTGLTSQEKPPKGLGVAYRHSCAYDNADVTIALDVLFARGQGGTEQKAIDDATVHQQDVRPVTGVGASGSVDCAAANAQVISDKTNDAKARATFFG